MRTWSTYDPVNFQRILGIAVSALIAQTNSFGIRPIDLPKPSSYDKSELQNFDTSNDWIRIAHYESELADQERYKFKKCVNYGGIIFTNENQTVFPYSRYQLYPFLIWEDGFTPELDATPIFTFIQHDPLEDFKILWINPILLRKLNLTICPPELGLKGMNAEEEIVLKYRMWNTDYLGHGYRTDVHDEIPKLDGAELLIRKDYFDKLILIFKENPKYSLFIVNNE